MDNSTWKPEAERMKFDDGLSWRQIAEKLHGCFPGKDLQQVTELVRTHVRRSPRYKQRSQPEYVESVDPKPDGSVVSDRLIEICDGDPLTPETLMVAHNLDPTAWQVVHSINNQWHSQVKGGTRLIMYQSKLVVKPKADGITFAEIDDHFRLLDRTYQRPTIQVARRDGRLMAEVNIADLHLGKLCWHGDTGTNYDYKIAKDLFYRLIAEICEELRGKPIEYITFVWSNDFFNSDTVSNTTTAGTPQDTDIRWQKLFNTGVEMLVSGVDMLLQVAPVRTFYTASNHDQVNSYHAIKYLEAWFRNEGGVEINIDAKPRKYQLYGVTLLGYTHGDREKPSRLASVMPIEARELWGQARFCEMHAAHLHSEHAIEEINGVIVRRISSPTATDTWHNDSGYIGAVRKAQTFLYDRDRGLLQTINTPV